MSATGHPVISCQGHPVWIRLVSDVIGPQDAAFNFSNRLARENGWSSDYADRVILEYKKFCFLAVTAGHEMTPSDAVDQAWHLHLTYTRDYWDRFCPDVLGQSLHHGPTAGGQAEGARFYDQYAKTLARYEIAFGESAPADLWPSAFQRLREDPKARRVHPRDGWIVPKKSIWYIGLAVLITVSLAMILR
jgi:hypothetical protein